MLLSILPLNSNLKLPLFHQPHFLSIHIRPFSKSQICFAFPSSNQDPLSDEARWLREENRWLREEQRWLREESRWNAERQALLQQISNLQLNIQELERLNSVQGASVTEIVANIGKLLQVLKEGDLNVNRIAESGSGPLPLVVEAAKKDEEEIVIKEVITSIPDKKETVKRMATLRVGSEGDEVGDMQEALEKLGFYSGEEDIEFSSFSSGTERAVKTWQATLGLREDGIMTTELLEQLFGNSGSKNQEHKTTDLEKNENGALVSSITDISEVHKSVVTKESVTEVSVFKNRVYLLGENRWEEPSRLSSSKQSAVTNNGSGNITTKCVACCGEGRVLCMECDGTGEPNVEEQFMEWVDEGAKCPYCEGLGYTTCDVCGGGRK